MNSESLEFFKASGGDLCYYPLLYLALEATKGDVIEMGTGHGSTPILHDYCTHRKRKLHSYETSKEWLSKFEATANDYHSFTLVCRTCWDVCADQHPSPSVVFIDHAPGERRKDDLIRFKDKAEIIVIHDSEPTGAGDYRVRQHFHKFKSVVEVQTPGAWATALSNTHDLSKWIGDFFNYKISAWKP